MPADRTPAPGRPHRRRGPAAIGIEGEQRDRHGGIHQGVPVDPPPGVGLGEPDRDAEDVGAVARRGPGRIHVGASRRRLDFQVAHRQTRRAVVVVKEVGPKHCPAGHAGRPAGSRKLFAERLSRRRRKRRLGPPSRRRRALRHPVDHDQFSRRRRRRVHHRVGDMAGDT